MTLKIMNIMKNWTSHGIPAYHTELQPHLKKYDNTILIQNYSEDIENNVKQISKRASKLKMLEEIVLNRPDVLIIFHYFGSPIALFIISISKLLKIKTIIVTDFTETGMPKIHKSILKTLKDATRYFLFNSQLFLADAPVCFTEYETEVLSKIFSSNSKFRIIPIGNHLEIGTSEKENFILTVSRWWSDRKNLHTILKSFSEVIKERDCKLIIAGKFHDGSYYISEEDRWETGEEYKQKTMDLIEDLNLKEHVGFVGVKTGGELQELYRKAKIFYLPSKNETFGMVFVEAMASGTPIVAMKNSAVQYVVKDEVTGFLRNTEEGQKEVILRLLTDEELYKQMQADCLEEAEKYRWENVIKEWEHLIEQLV